MLPVHALASCTGALVGEQTKGPGLFILALNGSGSAALPLTANQTAPGGRDRRFSLQGGFHARGGKGGGAKGSGLELLRGRRVSHPITSSFPTLPWLPPELYPLSARSATGPGRAALDHSQQTP